MSAYDNVAINWLNVLFIIGFPLYGFIQAYCRCWKSSWRGRKGTSIGVLD